MGSGSLGSTCGNSSLFVVESLLCASVRKFLVLGQFLPFFDVFGRFGAIFGQFFRVFSSVPDFC